MTAAATFGSRLAAIAATGSRTDPPQARLTGEDAQQARELRQLAFDFAYPYETTFFVSDANDQVFEIAVRDAVPFEDQDGSVRLP